VWLKGGNASGISISVSFPFPLTKECGSKVATLVAGDWAGELSVLANNVSRARIMCGSEKGEIHVVDSAKINAIFATRPDLATVFYSQLAYELALRLNIALIQAGLCRASLVLLVLTTATTSSREPLSIGLTSVPLRSPTLCASSTRRAIASTTRRPSFTTMLICTQCKQ
jgi:hypothetical protein